MMRILFLLCSDVSREQRIGKEIETLIDAGYEVTVLELPPTDQIVTSSNRDYNIHVFHLWTRRLPKNLLFWPLKFLEMTIQFLIIGRKLKPNIIHCVDRMPLLAAFLLAYWLGIPYLYDSQEIHSGVESSANKPKWLWLWIERRLAQRAIRVLVTDHFRQDLTADILRLNRMKIFVLMNLPKIPNTNNMLRDLRSDIPWQGKNLAIYAGAINPNRHIETIIKSLTFLSPAYCIALIGFVEGKYKAELQGLAEQLNVSEQLTILPPVKWSELPSYIASADCAFAFYEKNSLNNYYCSPSKLFDALMAGLPVISSDNPLIVEVLQQHGVGICIADVTPKAIAEAVMDIITSQDRFSMKEKAFNIARSHYNWESQVQSFIEFYRKVEKELPPPLFQKR